ncbi:MAG: hypothetical protein JXK94_11925 [Deltaproteobacteria bacterium]|nr:hypothetical protein [Deltaproteobacteria bacterium]
MNNVINRQSQTVLLISGPSGCGKSTFIQQLSQKTLDQEIQSCISPFSNQWPVIEANDLLKGNLSKNSFLARLKQADGVVVHYDIMFIQCRGMARYEEDEALALLSSIGPLKIVFIRPKYKVLQHQYSKRRNIQRGEKSPGSRFWADYIRYPARKVFAPIRRKLFVSNKEIYQTDELLLKSYLEWGAFIDRLSESQKLGVLVVEPISDFGKNPAFRLVSKSSTVQES